MDELQDFAEKRLQRECGFFGIFLPQGHREQLIAGGMLFYFLHVNAAHTQYLAASSEYRKYNPATYLYYYIINVVREQGFEKLSFGISTERRGEYLNERLIESKEDYGSKHSVNRKFWKNLDGCGEIQR